MKGITPMQAMSHLSRSLLLVAAAVALAACGRDVAAPTTGSSLTPRGAEKALVGAIDGVYTVSVDPSKADTLSFGKSYLVIPPQGICDLGNSGYGSNVWNSPCKPQQAPVVITAVVRNALTTNPSIEFQPALRFNPATTVNLYIYVTDAATLSNMTVMKYCSGELAWSCVDESLTDTSLRTNINPGAGLVWRRIKHFSGYLIAE